MACLVLCSLMSTLLSIALIFYSSTKTDAAIPGLISLLASSLDVTVNSLCFLLYWSFADKWYQLICRSCNKFMINQCTRNVQHYVHRATSASVGSASITTSVPTSQKSQSAESSIIINEQDENVGNV